MNGESKKIGAKAIFKGFAWIIGFIVAFYVLNAYIDNKIDKKINNPSYIKKVASHVRPFIIFDENESILADSGGMEYIEDIKVEAKADRFEPIKIIITPKSHLAYPPLLEVISPYEVSIDTKRGIHHRWIYEVSVEGRLGPDTTREIDPIRFKLEIIK